MKRLLRMRLKLVCPAGGLGTMAMHILPAAGTVLRILELVIGPNDYAAVRTITVTYGLGLAAGPTLTTTLGTLMSEAIDNVVRVVIPRGAAVGAPDTTYHRDMWPGFLCSCIGAQQEALLISGASIAAAEEITVEIRAILEGTAGNVIPTVNATATATWTTFAGNAYYISLSSLDEDFP